MGRLFFSLHNFEIKRLLVLTFGLLFISAFIANAGDTVFTSLPDTRYLDPNYMQQVFIDEFNGNRIDTSVWWPDLCKSRGYSGNNEAEPNNVQVSNGTLKLFVRHEPGNIDTNCWENTHFVSDFTTAEIASRMHRYKYGSFEARCFMPRGDHYSYAYWLWGPGGFGYPKDGFTSEIDIAEGVEWSDGTNHELKSSLHYWPQNGFNEIKLPKDWTNGFGTVYEGNWHVFKLIWNPYELTVYVDNIEIWKRTKYYRGLDARIFDVGINQIKKDIAYSERIYFPNDEMETVFQMHVQKDAPIAEMPIAMEVDYVKVSQYFLAPEIDCPSVIFSEGKATLDVDSMASDITWQLAPSGWFATPGGKGKIAVITKNRGAQGTASITYNFKMPSGELFTATHEFVVKEITSIVETHDGSGNLLIFPNPAEKTATISLGNEFIPGSECTLEIFTAGMQLQLRKTGLSESEFSIDVAGWAKGVYLVRIASGTRIITGKLMVGE